MVDVIGATLAQLRSPYRTQSIPIISRLAGSTPSESGNITKRQAILPNLFVRF